MSRFLLRRGLAATLSLMLLHAAAAAEDALKIAVGQRGGWEQCVSELGQNAGIFKKHGLALEVLYTQGSGETIRSCSPAASMSASVRVRTRCSALLPRAPRSA
jgi:ABC-type nitrate/sulfonate/bicarbonate transport system substrate-binding protein